MKVFDIAGENDCQCEIYCLLDPPTARTNYHKDKGNLAEWAFNTRSIKS